MIWKKKMLKLFNGNSKRRLEPWTPAQNPQFAVLSRIVSLLFLSSTLAAGMP